MDKKAVIEKILRVSLANTNQGNLIGGVPSLMSHPHSMQPELNNAITTWLQQNDPQPLKGIVNILHTMNAFSADEADKLLIAIESQGE